MEKREGNAQGILIWPQLRAVSISYFSLSLVLPRQFPVGDCYVIVLHLKTFPGSAPAGCPRGS